MSSERRVSAGAPSMRRYWRQYKTRIVFAALVVPICIWAQFLFSLPSTWKNGVVPSALERCIFMLRLFAGNLPESLLAAPAPRQVHIVLLLAILVSIAAILQALTSILSRGFTWVWLCLFYRRHVIICGLNRESEALARSYRKSGARVIIIEKDAAHTGADALLDEGIRVHFGDATSPRVLRGARAMTARLVVLFCDPETNSEIQNALANACQVAETAPPTCFMSLGDHPLYRTLQWFEYANRAAGNARHVRFFNVSECGAGHLVRRESLPAGMGQPIHYVVVGFGAMGRELVAGLTRRWELGRNNPDAERMWLTIVDRNAVEQIDWMSEEHSALKHWWHALPHQMDVRSASFTRAGFLFPKDAPPPAKIFVCLNDDELSLMSALVLLRALIREGRKIPIVLRMYEHSGLMWSSILQRENIASEWTRLLEPFCILDVVMTPDGLESTAPLEQIAIALHEGYLANEQKKESEARKKGNPFDRRPAAVPWEVLPDNYRESNRRQAASIGQALASLPNPRRIVPLHDGEAFMALADDEVLFLAKQEHERWMREKSAAGLVPPGSSDPNKAVHRDLIPWSQLEPEDQSKDMNTVRTWQQALQGAGLGLRRGNG